MRSWGHRSYATCRGTLFENEAKPGEGEMVVRKDGQEEGGEIVTGEGSLKISTEQSAFQSDIPGRIGKTEGLEAPGPR